MQGQMRLAVLGTLAGMHLARSRRLHGMGQLHGLALLFALFTLSYVAAGQILAVESVTLQQSCNATFVACYESLSSVQPLNVSEIAFCTRAPVSTELGDLGVVFAAGRLSLHALPANDPGAMCREENELFSYALGTDCALESVSHRVNITVHWVNDTVLAAPRECSMSLPSLDVPSYCGGSGDAPENSIVARLSLVDPCDCAPQAVVNRLVACETARANCVKQNGSSAVCECLRLRSECWANIPCLTADVVSAVRKSYQNLCDTGDILTGVDLLPHQAASAFLTVLDGPPVLAMLSPIGVSFEELRARLADSPDDPTAVISNAIFEGLAKEGAHKAVPLVVPNELFIPQEELMGTELSSVIEGSGTNLPAACRFRTLSKPICPPLITQRALHLNSSSFGTFVLWSSFKGDSVANASVKTRDARLQDGVSVTSEIWCDEMQYWFIDVTEDVPNMRIIVEQDQETCPHESKGNDVTQGACPFGVLYLKKDDCPTHTSYLFRQTFSSMAFMSLSHTAYLEPGRYVIGVHASVFSADFDEDTGRRTIFEEVYLDQVRCCSRPWKYTLTVTFEGDKLDLLYAFCFMFVVFVFVPSIVTYCCYRHRYNRVLKAIEPLRKDKETGLQYQADAKPAARIVEMAQLPPENGSSLPEFRGRTSSLLTMDPESRRLPEFEPSILGFFLGEFNQARQDSAEQQPQTHIVVAGQKGETMQGELAPVQEIVDPIVVFHHSSDVEEVAWASPAAVSTEAAPLQQGFANAAAAIPAKADQHASFAPSALVDLPGETATQPVSKPQRPYTLPVLTSMKRKQMSRSKAKLSNISSPARRSAFWVLLLMIGVFCAIPAVQYELLTERLDDISFNQCHFNNRCRRDVNLFGWVTLKAFNAMMSNMGYVAAGLLLIVYVKLDSGIKKLEPEAKSGKLRYEDPSMFYAIGVAIVVEGFFSAIYHMCPTMLFYQFDTIFIFFCAGILFAALYSRRHVNTGFRPSAFFTFFAITVTANTVGMYLMMNGVYKWFWVGVMPLFLVFAVYMTVKFIFLGATWAQIRRIIRQKGVAKIVKENQVLCVAVAVLWIANLTILIVCAVLEAIPSDMFLACNVTNFVLYLHYYFYRKYKLGDQERFPLLVKVAYACLVAFTLAAFYFYASGSSNKGISLHQSRLVAKDCLFLVFDPHDCWHMLGACALFTLGLVIYHLDDESTFVPSAVNHRSDPQLF